jgi:hypothetical protein
MSVGIFEGHCGSKESIYILGLKIAIQSEIQHISAATVVSVLCNFIVNLLNT